jgi:hypothetical protein
MQIVKLFPSVPTGGFNLEAGCVQTATLLIIGNVPLPTDEQFSGNAFLPML